MASEHINSLMTHLHNEHDIKRSDGGFAKYVAKYFVAPLCACGCGRPVELHSREFGYSMFAPGCKAIDRCRNPSCPEFYLFKGMSVDEAIEALRVRQESLGRRANTEQHIKKLSLLNAGNGNPASLISVMQRESVGAAEAHAILNDRRKASTGFSGKKHGAETRAKMAKMRSGQSKVVTKPELVIWGMLHALGVEFEFQYPIGPYVVDFYVPHRMTAIDVFGDYWHARAMSSRHSEKEACDAARNVYLISNSHVTHVLWESEVMGSPQTAVKKLRSICD